MKIYPFASILPKLDMISSPDTFFNTVKYEYSEYVRSGFFKEDAKQALYIYNISNPATSHTGIVACVDINEYIDGNILKHENTLPDKEQRMLNLLLQRKALVKPLLFTHPNIKSLSTITAKTVAQSKPLFSVTLDGKEKHSFYRISQKDKLGQLLKIFNKSIPQVFIADGHHRSAAIAKMYRMAKKLKTGEKSYRYLLAAFFPFDELQILDYNRVVEILNEITPTLFMAKLSRICDIKPIRKATKPRSKHEMTMYINREWYQLQWRKNVLARYKQKEVLLDAYILNREIMESILKIREVRADARIKYVEGVLGLKGLIDRTLKNSSRIGFCVYPVEMQEFVQVSRLGQTLPPKSTWFEPRMRSGLIVKSF